MLLEYTKLDTLKFSEIQEHKISYEEAKYINSKLSKRNEHANEYVIKDTYIEVYIFKKEIKYTVLVDLEDINFVKDNYWSLNDRLYALTRVHLGSENGVVKRKLIFLHSLVMNAKEHEYVDHINGNVLDNRKDNLRICTIAENSRNRVKSSINKSGYKGVSYNSYNKKWRSNLTYNYSNIHVGYFTTKEEAAEAYNKKAVELFGEFAKLNIIDATILKDIDKNRELKNKIEEEYNKCKDSLTLEQVLYFSNVLRIAKSNRKKFTTYTILEDCIEIYLEYKGIKYTCYTDKCVENLLKECYWNVVRNGNKFTVKTSIYIRSKNITKTFYLHRIVAGANNNNIVTFKDGDWKNIRLNNLIVGDKHE